MNPSADAEPLPAIVGYEITQRLGHGGMGIVYKARRRSDQRWVALKMIVGTHPQLKQRFRREVTAVARLRHPDIVELYDTGEHEGWPFFTMELVTGGNLAENRGRFVADVPRAVTLVERLARAVHHAHELGIVHRDLKPANVLLDADGAPRITDFGLAKVLDAEAESLTDTSAIMGTPAYMAPEVAWGGTRDAGPAVDVYALGAILYELLTGQVPFRGGTLEVLDQIRTRSPCPPSDRRSGLPRRLDLLCLRCLEKSPAMRPRSALLLAEELSASLSGHGTDLASIPEPAAHTTSAGQSIWPTTVGGHAALPDGALPSLPGLELLERRGTSGLSEVYRARLLRDDRIVAVRVPNWRSHHDIGHRFRVEAEVRSRLRHPGLTQLFAVGEVEGRVYLVEEFLDGGSLLNRLRHGPLRACAAADLFAGLADALHYLHHALGSLVLHRNLSPGAVLIFPDGRAKLSGFGLLHAPQFGSERLDANGVPAGTVGYMAPEQVRVARDEFGPATDVYGLGVTLYAALTGRPPLDAPPQQPPSLVNPTVSPSLDAVCLKATAKNPTHRHASAAELAEELRREAGDSRETLDPG